MEAVKYDEILQCLRENDLAGYEEKTVIINGEQMTILVKAENNGWKRFTNNYRKIDCISEQLRQNDMAEYLLHTVIINGNEYTLPIRKGTLYAFGYDFNRSEYIFGGGYKVRVRNNEY